MIKIISAKINTVGIWAEYPSPNYPEYEFYFDSLIAKRTEGTEEPDFVFSPNAKDAPFVVARNLYQWKGERRFTFEDCEKELGATHWTLLEILVNQKKKELDDAFDAEIIARNYTVDPV